MPSLVTRTVLHLDPPFALSTNMAARTHNTSVLIDARVVPSLVRDRPGYHDGCIPRDAEALREIRRRRHAASIPLKNRLVPGSRRAVVVVPDDPDKRARCIDGFYTRKATPHRPVLASLQKKSAAI
jgi:hypothetical protein